MDNLFSKDRLHFAAQNGNVEEIKQIVAEGCDINRFDDIGYTPLHYAIKVENLEVAQLLINMGADVNAHDSDRAGNTPLAEVAKNCSFEVARFLIENGADPTIPGWMGLSALDRASNRKKPEGRRVYELLVDRKTNPIRYTTRS